MNLAPEEPDCRRNRPELAGFRGFDLVPVAPFTTRRPAKSRNCRPELRLPRRRSSRATSRSSRRRPDPYTDLPLAFPALRSLDSTPNNLPQQLTSFIGREQEIEQIKSLFTRTPLLTLTGAGGCGKTRLRCTSRPSSSSAYPDGVWLVELARFRIPRSCRRRWPRCSGCARRTGKSLAQTLTEHLKSRQVAAGARQFRAPARRLRAAGRCAAAPLPARSCCSSAAARRSASPAS